MASSQSKSPKQPHQTSRPSVQGRQAQVRQPRARFAPEYEVLLHQLIEARKSAGVTQEEIARRIGKTQSHVSMCENREREISIIDLWKWCAALGISLTEFIRQFEENLRVPAR